MKACRNTKKISGRLDEPILVVLNNQLCLLSAFIKVRGKWKGYVEFPRNGVIYSTYFYLKDIKVVESIADVPYTPPPLLTMLLDKEQHPELVKLGRQVKKWTDKLKIKHDA